MKISLLLILQNYVIFLSVVLTSKQSNYNHNTTRTNVHIDLLNSIQSPNDIIFFHGLKTSDILENHATSFPRRNIRKWSDFVMFLNKISSQTNAAFHIHNRHLKIGDILQLIIAEVKWQKKIAPRNSSFEPTREEILSAMNQGQKPVLLSNIVNENWGLLSDGNKNMQNIMIIHLITFKNSSF